MNRELKESRKLRYRKGIIRYGVHLFVWIGIAISYYIVFSIFFDTPIERELRLVNDDLSSRYNQMRGQYDSLQSVVDNVIERDRSVYNILFDAEPYLSDNQGEQDYIAELASMSNNQLAELFFDKIGKTESRVKEITSALDTLQLSMILDGDKLLYIPSIQPIANNELTKLASSYGMRIHPFYRTMVSHQGVDYAVSEDSRVYATANGRVESVNATYRTNGLSVIINHGNGFKSVYSHLSKSLVRKGEKVSRGDIIARSGNSGLSIMPHLHYEVVYNGVRQDPLNYFFQELTPIKSLYLNEIAKTTMQSLD